MYDMWDNRCIVVEAGRELSIGSDASCDVFVTSASLRRPGFRSFSTRCRVMVRVSCSTKGELLLHFSSSDVLLYIEGIRVVPCKQPVELLAGVPVSFGRPHKQTTYRFFTGGICVGVLAPVPQDVSCITTVTNPRLTANASEALKLSFSSSHTAPGQQLHRSERVVQFVAPFGVNGGALEKTHDFIPTPTPSLSRPCGGTRDTCQMASEPVESLTDCIVSPSPHVEEEEEEFLPPSPHAIAPFVVEVWGQRASMHSVVGHRVSDLKDDSQSSSPHATRGGTATTEENDNIPEPYVTWHGRRMLRARRHLRFETSVRSVAASVLECIDDAYSSDEDTFLQFTEHRKRSLFRHSRLLTEHAKMVMMTTSMTVKRRSPIFCCGDIHGSFFDLKTVYNSVVPFHHWSLMTTPVVFLGDYVDRGPHDVEVILYLLAWHALCPDSVVLLRGNHEDEGINGDVELYGDTSFLTKCRKFFGEEDGEVFWGLVNDVFANLPVVAIIDDTIFACHGGIPRLRCCRPNGRKNDIPHAESDAMQKCWCEEEGAREEEGNHAVPHLAEVTLEDDDDDDIPSENLFQLLIDGTPDVLGDIRFRSLMPVADDDDLTARRRRLIRELLWNDPTPSSSSSSSPSSSCKPHFSWSGIVTHAVADDRNHAIEASRTGSSLHAGFDVHGFRSNVGRGGTGNVIREFNTTALNSFMRRWGFTFLIRAHQQKMAGLEMGFSGRILTLFSCSNYAGDMNRAGACMIVDEVVHPVSWRHAETTRRTAEAAPPFWHVMQNAACHSGSFSESVSSSYGRPMLPQSVPLYVEMKSRDFG